MRKRSHCSAVSPNTQEHLFHQDSLQAMVGKLCGFSKVTFPNACHRAFCYCTSCHLTFPSQTYIQKSFFYRKCSDNDQIYVLWNFGFYKDYMPKPWKSLSLSFADFFQSIVVLSVDLLIRSSLLVTCRLGLLKEPLERSGFTRSLTSTTLPQCSNMLT